MSGPLRIRGYDLHILNMHTRMPFRYGIASMTVCPHLFARVELEMGGRVQRGIAADHLPPKWFTKNPQTPYADDVRDMIAVIRSAFDFAAGAEPAESVFDLWAGVYAQQKAWATERGFPPLLWNFGVSLVERATIDAFCRGTRTTFSKAVRENLLGLDVQRLHRSFGDPQTGDALAHMTPRDALPAQPLRSVIARHTVGLSDPLTESDIPAGERVDDGLPQSLDQCIRAYGLTHFKIKLCGDAARDLARLGALSQIIPANTRGRFAFTLDGNENFHEIAPFQALWKSLAADSNIAAFLQHLIFVEQPLHRDVALGDGVAAAMRGWPDRPPMIIDESDATVASFPRALACGYAGTSHKNCKGIFKSLANACLAARTRRTRPDGVCLLSGEDLSNVGPVALLQDLAACATLGIDHVERNGHHYFTGLTMLPVEVREQALAHHGDLYHRHTRGFPAVNIRAGRIAVGSVVDAPFGIGFELDAARFTPLEKWEFSSLSL